MINVQTLVTGHLQSSKVLLGDSLMTHWLLFFKQWYLWWTKAIIISPGDPDETCACLSAAAPTSCFELFQHGPPVVFFFFFLRRMPSVSQCPVKVVTAEEATCALCCVSSRKEVLSRYQYGLVDLWHWFVLHFVLPQSGPNVELYYCMLLMSPEKSLIWNSSLYDTLGLHSMSW